MAQSFTIPSIFTAIDRFSGPMRMMGRANEAFAASSRASMAIAERSYRRLLSPLTKVNNMLMGLGYYAGLYSLVRVVGNAIDIFADFQQANVNLATVMETTAQANRVLALDARKIGLNYGKAATEVVNMQHSLATLGFLQSDILKMGAPLITGSVALEGADPKRLAETVGAVINSFDKLGAGDTQHILDVMAMAANRTALDFDKLATTLPIVSAPANALNIKFEDTVALLGLLANAGVHVATSATSLKNIFIDSQKRGHTYVQMLENVAKNVDKLTFAYNKFGKRSVVSALLLSNQLREAKTLAMELENAQLGLTSQIAIDRLNTYRGSVQLAKAAYQEFILSIEDGTGKYSMMLQNLMKTTAAMLLLSSDSDAARGAIAKMDPVIVKTAESYLGWLKVIGYVIAGLIAIKVALILWSAALKIWAVLQFGYNVLVGISVGLGWANAAAIHGSTVALVVAKGVIKAATAAQFLWNAALAANPIGLIIIAISLLAAWILIVIDRWNSWGAAISVFMGPLGFAISMVQSFRRNWDAVGDAFTNGGMIAGIKKIGLVIVDAILMPIQQIYKLLANVPGTVGTSAQKMVDVIEAYRNATGANTATDEEGNQLEGNVRKINPREQERVLRERYEESQKMSMSIDINDPSNRTAIRTNNFPEYVNVRLSSTMQGAQ